MSRHVMFVPAHKPDAHGDGTRQEPALAAGRDEQKATVVDRLPYLRTLANFYVVVKSCPLIILAGPAGSGKLTLARLTAHLLGGSQRASSMIGHAKWAAGSAHSGELVEAQTRLNKNALFALVQEAWQPEQQGQPFVACLRRISPAELDPFFTREGLDLLCRQFLGWRQTSALPLLPLPPNLTLMATIDTDHFRWWDETLLDAATVVPWPEPLAHGAPAPYPGPLPLLCGARLLHSAIREATVAHERLRQVLPPSTRPFRRLLQIAGALEEAGVCMPRAVMNRVTIFAANAWSESGAGLFAPDPLANLDCALQLGIIQYVLPWLVVHGHEDAMRAHLFPRLDEAYQPLLTLLADVGITAGCCDPQL